jgi:hypothetical protein
MTTPPRIDFDGGADGSDARIRLTFGDVLLHVHRSEGEPPLGTLAIDRGTIEVSPYWSVAGGVSFALNENRWELSATGIEFNVDLLGTMLEELAFGETFETRSSPLWAGGFGSWSESIAPRVFRHEGGYLVIGLGGGLGAQRSETVAGAAADFPEAVVSQTNR